MTNDTITADTLTHSDIGRLIDDLNAVRNRFGQYEDDYRQAKIDVAIQQLEDIGELIAELQAANEWEDPDLHGVPAVDKTHVVVTNSAGDTVVAEADTKNRAETAHAHLKTRKEPPKPEGSTMQKGAPSTDE